MNALTLANFYTFTRALLRPTPTRPFTGTVLVYSTAPLSMSYAPNAVKDRDSSHENTPIIFKNKCKGDKCEDWTKQKLVVSYAGKIRHHPPAIKEWFNSIYTYNKGTTKVLPSWDKNVFNLIKSYFNIYSSKEERYTKSRPLRVRRRKASISRVFVGKPYMKHTNDKVIIVAHTYDRRKKLYINRSENTISMENLKKKVLGKNKSSKLKAKLIKENQKMSFFMYNLKQKSTTIQPKVNKHSTSVLEKTIIGKHISMLKYFGKVYFKTYVEKYLQTELVSIKRRQFMFLEKFKYNKHYMSPFINLIERIYGKQVIFNVINLKYFYNSASILSQAIIAKLRNRKNKPTRVLRAFLNTFELPPINRLAIYNETYNKIKTRQNIQIKNISTTEPYVVSSLANNEHNHQSKYDLVDKSLTNLSNGLAFSSSAKSPVSLNDIVGLVKRKFTSGIRIELAGRLTKRNTAARSMFKLRYKGSVKNADSSQKSLSAVLLRGYAKSNLQYNQAKSKVRIGSFGLKTWVSSN